MIFTSLAYGGFLIVVLALHWALPPTTRPLLLLVASYVFYATWSVPAIAILVATSLVAWGAGLVLPRLEGLRRDLLTAGAVGLSLAALVAFKVAGAFSVSGDAQLNAVIPVGLSFFSFQAISYIVDVRRGHLEPSQSLPDVALYLSFFPHLLAGPIVRADKLIPAFHSTPRRPDRVQWAEAGELILVGVFKKVAIADPIFAQGLTGASGLSHLGTVNLTITLVSYLLAGYFDVTGYIDIARGSAKLLGIDMQRNSLTPLTVTTGYADFWRRWQLTIMMWFRDYLFLPLRGDGRSRRRNDLAMFATFFALGAWHGFTPGWLLWGVASGFIIVGEQELQHRRAARRQAQRRAARKARSRALLPPPPTPRRRQAVTLFLVLVSLPIAFGLREAKAIYSGFWAPRSGAIDANLVGLVVLGLVALILVDARERRREAVAGRPDPVRPQRAVAFGLMVLAIAVFSGPAPRTFLYFHF